MIMNMNEQLAIEMRSRSLKLKTLYNLFFSVLISLSFIIISSFFLFYFKTTFKKYYTISLLFFLCSENNKFFLFDY